VADCAAAYIYRDQDRGQHYAKNGRLWGFRVQTFDSLIRETMSTWMSAFDDENKASQEINAIMLSISQRQHTIEADRREWAHADSDCMRAYNCGCVLTSLSVSFFFFFWCVFFHLFLTCSFSDSWSNSSV